MNYSPAFWGMCWKMQREGDKVGQHGYIKPEDVLARMEREGYMMLPPLPAPVVVLPPLPLPPLPRLT